MPQFYYKARNLLGQRVTGLMVVSDELELEERLRINHLFLVEAKKEGGPKRVPLFGAKIARTDVITFTVHLAVIFSAGVPLLQGLEDLRAQTDKKSFQFIIGQIIEDVQGGSSISAALAKHPKVFSEVYVNMVAAGELSGNMPTILNEMVRFLEWQEALTTEIKRATTYPTVVFIAVVALVTILYTFAFPRIFPVLLSMKVPLPFVTRLVIGVSQFFSAYWHVLLAAIFLIFFAIKLARRRPGGKLFLDGVMLRLPVIGDLARKIALSRFAHHLGALFRAGVDISKSLATVEQVVGNAVIARAIATTRERVLEGATLWYSLQQTGVFSPLVIRMVSIGETSGKMDETLVKVCQYYDQEVPAAVKRLFSVVEPLIIVFLALLVVVSALAMYLPLYSALGRISGGKF
ncbi:MAG: type II secretion system F family protein [Deltaproteobacteria bacterium]|nr:type II secretion system F family protein [Deltaproteobacteria bacterium]